MASIPITIQNAVIVPNSDGTVTISGMAYLTGLSVGGGPMPGGPPLGFWGGKPPPFVDIGGPPPQPGIWPNPPEGSVLPEHPIVLPPDLPPTLPPPDERPIDWKVVWTPQTGWAVIGVPQGPHVTPSK